MHFVTHFAVRLYKILRTEEVDDYNNYEVEACGSCVNVLIQYLFRRSLESHNTPEVFPSF